MEAGQFPRLNEAGEFFVTFHLIDGVTIGSRIRPFYINRKQISVLILSLNVDLRRSAF